MTLIETFKELMHEAHKRINESDNIKEAGKLGVLRAGSAGAWVHGNVYATQCGRLAQARLLGYQATPTEEMRVMFNGGTTLEQYLEQRFQILNIPFKKEESYTIELQPGITVSGRPDFEIEINEKTVGIEVKSLASPFSVIKQRKNRFPFMKHMIQAATYMTMLDRDEWLIVIGNSFNVNQNGAKIPSELKWYQLKFLNECFVIFNEQGHSQVLPFSKEHIIAYYKEVKGATSDRVLMARPTELELNVDTYDRCKYCYMQSSCNEYDNKQISFEQWLEKITLTKES